MLRFFSFILMVTCPLFAGLRSPKIVVVGAGFSGLTTAYALAKQGWDVELYEARNRIGGRVFTVNVKGHAAELGGQNIFDGGRAEHILALISELGLELETKQTAMRFHYYLEDELFDAKKLCRQDPQALKMKLETYRSAPLFCRGTHLHSHGGGRDHGGCSRGGSAYRKTDRKVFDRSP